MNTVRITTDKEQFQRLIPFLMIVVPYRFMSIVMIVIIIAIAASGIPIRIIHHISVATIGLGICLVIVVACRDIAFTVSAKATMPFQRVFPNCIKSDKNIF